MMRFDTQTAADYAAQKLDSLLERASRDSETVLAAKNLPDTLAYFYQLRETVKALNAKMAKLQSHIDALNQEQIPTMFLNQRAKTVTVEEVGRCSINDRWSASMVEKDPALAFLEEIGEGGMIQRTVNAQTLGAFAKDRAKAKKPLPADLFKVSSTPYVSITKV